MATFKSVRFASIGALAAMAITASAQTPPATQQATLTLEEALHLARERNGNVAAARYDYRAAQARVDQARANFYPEITPSYVYNSNRRQVAGAGAGTRFIQSEGGSSQINATMRLLDLGERQFNLLSTQASAGAQRANTQETLRQVLFQVHADYFDTLRFEELVRAAQAQVQRAQSILEQTTAQAEVGQIARKDILQAQADLANARVQQLSAENNLSNARALLKADIGWDTTAPLPPLVAVQPPSGGLAALSLPSLDTLVAQGLENRTDLIAARRQTESLRYNSLRAEREATASLALDASFAQQLTPDSLEDRALVLNVSLPWLDFGRTRSAARQARYNLQAQRSQLAQLERNARSEIEAAYQQVTQNAERLTASQTAVEAARLNYQAASESQRLGVGTIVDVITAQASLATAEANLVESLYDYQTSTVRLQLATGQTLEGEQPAVQ